MFDLVPFARQERNLLSRMLGDSNRLLDSAWSGAMCTDIEDRGDHFLLSAELPGFTQDDIQIEVQGEQLHLRAQQKQAREEETRNFVYRERRTSRYDRRFDIRGIDQAGIRASLSNGVLELTLPKRGAETAEARRIAVETAEALPAEREVEDGAEG